MYSHKINRCTTEKNHSNAHNGMEQPVRSIIRSNVVTNRSPKPCSHCITTCMNLQNTKC